MSQANVELVRSAYDSFERTGQFAAHVATTDFVWDMSKFSGWPEQQLYEGAEGAEQFLREWVAAWEDWRLELEALHDAGDRVVAIVRQHGRSRTTGMPVDMHFAQVWSLKDGAMARMEMYADTEEALRAVGLDPSALD
jgi:ketosteroid isomerase-like protein